MLPLTELVLEECVGAAYHCMSTLEVRNEVLECVLVMGAKKIYVYILSRNPLWSIHFIRKTLGSSICNDAMKLFA